MKLVFLVIGLMTMQWVAAQDSLYTRKMLQELTSEKYNGRGYVKNGDVKAAAYLSAEFRRLGLQPGAAGKWMQPFSFPVNSFPGKMKVKLDGVLLKPGVDFIVSPGMSSLNGEYEVITISKKQAGYTSSEIRGKFILIDTCGTGFSVDKEDVQAWKKNYFGAVGMIWVQPKKLTWSVSTSDGGFPVIDVMKEVIKSPVRNIQVGVEAKFIPDYKTGNVIGMVPGTQFPDSFVLVTAHYDHLGCMGSATYFPGANDNASGVSMLLNLAAHFSKPENRLPFTIVFIAFAGEEAGLIGSEYYTEHPTVPLSSIRFLLNLDLLGTGDDGMMVVNATEFPEAFSLLDSINTAQSLLPKLGQRGKAANSDHYFFSEKGVPAFFCYTMGGISAYHDVFDIEQTLPLTKYRQVYELLRSFLFTMTSESR